jgi:GH24 family phage-related lysozyme (muramidase)
MTNKAKFSTTPSVNEGMSMSPEARARMRRRESDVYNYYDDMGPGRGNCTWGAGILAHKKPCTEKELATPVSAAEVAAEFSRRIAVAEGGVRHNVRKQKLTQDQFDALVSFTYNAGVRGASHTHELVDSGEFAKAAANISRFTSATVNGQRVLARGLIARRAEESAPFRSIETAAALAKK